MADHDLSGDWIGIYNYPDTYPPTQFQALLRDDGGRITGETRERDELFTGGKDLRALIDGSRDGDILTFVKIYEDEAFNSEIVRYEGQIQPDGTEISGHWEVPGIWAGTFIMMREGGAEESVERKVGETIDVD